MLPASATASKNSDISTQNVNLEHGLSAAQVESARTRFGFNEVTAPHPSIVKEFFSNFFGLAPLVLEATIVATLALQDWVEAGVVIGLLFFNVFISFAQSRRAAAALAKLNKSLQLTARVLRDGQWSQVASRELVPGDVIRLRHGDIVAADTKVGKDEVQVDQSALTGESNAIPKPVGEIIFAGSIVQSGEACGIVASTGMATKYNKTVELVRFSSPKLHVSRIINWIVFIQMTIGLILVLIAIILILVNPTTRPSFVNNLPTLLLLIVLAAPITLPPMITLSLALGSLSLSKQNVLVTRLNALEDASSMTVLCTDKTGTLTSNRLSVVGEFCVAPFSDEDVIRHAAAACKEGDFSAIDMAVLEACPVRDWEEVEFIPFSAATRKTVAVIRREGKLIRVAMGAVKTILKLFDDNDADLQAKVSEQVAVAGRAGQRSMAVSMQDASTGSDTLDGPWRLVGLFYLADPPRKDTADIIARLHTLGIRVIMITGDSLAIARHVSQEVGIGSEVKSLAESRAKVGPEGQIAIEDLASLTGLAEVFPEEKHSVVKQLQSSGCIVGMTGDGVNDAPALKQAEVGIAMSNATDVAKSSASAVLLTEGLSAVPEMIVTGRLVHSRLFTWMMVRVVKTFQTIGFVVILFCVTGQWVLAPLNLLELLFLVDFVTLALSTDNASVAASPCKWDIKHIVMISLGIGAVSLGEGLGLYYVLIPFVKGETKLINTVCFENVFFMGISSMFTLRARGFFWQSRPSFWFLAITLVDVVFVIIACSVGIDALALSRIDFWITAVTIAWSFVFQVIINNFILIIMFKKLMPHESVVDDRVLVSSPNAVKKGNGAKEAVAELV